MSDEANLWHIGPISFPTSALLFPVVAGLIVWALAHVCMHYRKARIPLLLIPVSLGAYIAYGALSAPSVYVADTVFGLAWLLSIITALGSLLLLPLRLTRRAGMIGFAAAGVLLLAFYITFLAGSRMGFYDWSGDKLGPIPAEEPK